MSIFGLLSGETVAGDIIEKGENFWFGATGGISKPKAGVDVDPETGMRCAVVYACTRAIAETLASLPPMVYEQMSGETRRKARDNSLYRLLHDQPNPDMDSMQFIELMTKRLVNRGNGFAEIIRDESGEPRELVPIHNSRVRGWRVGSTSSGGRHKRGAIEWHISLSDRQELVGSKDVYYVIPNEDMLNIVGFNSRDGIMAPGVIPMAAEEISLNTATQLYGASFFGNGARPLGIVQHPGFPPNPEARTEFRSDVNAIHQGHDNWNKVGVLWGGAEWKELQVSPEQAQMIETRKLSGKVLCQYYGVPPAIVQIFDDFKFSTVEAMLKQFVMLTLRPYAVRWERAIGSQILTDLDSELLFEFVLNALLRGDPLTQAQANEIKLRNAALNVDEWRSQDNENPLPNGLGQHHFMTLNHAPIEQVVAGAAVVRDAKKDGTSKVSTLEPMKKFALKVIDDSFVRLRAIEEKAIRRAANDSSHFLSTIDDFYRSFAEKLANAIQPGIEGWLQAIESDSDPEDEAFFQAVTYTKESRKRLLAVAECNESELEASVEEALSLWTARTIPLMQKKKEASSDRD